MKLLLPALLIATASAKNYPVPNDANCLVQVDFDQGTKIISSPGVYKLCENISFGPNGPVPGQLPDEDAFDPVFDGSLSANEYGLGFFSAISITSSDVTIHLNGFTIEQSAGHALMQRFFSIFELASSPFIPSVGPAQFVGDGEVFAPASNVNILGPGVIGRSSHHGIHGNDNTNVKIAAIEFRDFEVAAVSLNNVDNLEISDCDVVHNRHDVPIVGLFSAARFLRPYGKYLKELPGGYGMDMYNSTSEQIEWRTAEDVYDKLIASINNVYEDVVVLGHGQIDATAHPEEYHLYNNPFNVVDGPCYAFLVHGRGPAVGGQGESFNDIDATVTSSNVVIRDNTINDIKCWNNEVPALFGTCAGGHGCAMNDARGAIFQTVKTFDSANPYLALGADKKYNGNVVSDMQIMVAKAIIDEILPDMPSQQTGPNSIDQGIVTWAESGGTLDPVYVCNGDSMHHVVKGMIAIRVEDTAGFSIEHNTITNVENLSVEPFANCDLFHIGASSENLNETQAGNVRAISVAAVRGFGNGESQIKNNDISSVFSDQANVIIGIDIQGDSKDTDIVNNNVDLQEGLFEDSSDSLIALRIRESVDGSITMSGNQLAQETQVLNSNGIRGRARALKNLHAHASGDIEWKMGGCPFASDYAKK